MTNFNNMTVVAACTILGSFHSHDDLKLLEAEWGISGCCTNSSKSARAADLANLALSHEKEVFMESGRVPLSRAIIERAIHAPEKIKVDSNWKKLIAGLRFDGFEIIERRIAKPPNQPWENETITTQPVLRKIYPEDVPSLDFREAESEVEDLLKKYSFSKSEGHLNQAIDNFSRGHWASANAQFRTFFESYLTEIAAWLGNTGENSAVDVRNFLGKLNPPFLLSDYNEWNENGQKPQFFQGLMSRMHPQGSHPGLSEEDDCTFRLHITLITARLILRRLDSRMS